MRGFIKRLPVNLANIVDYLPNRVFLWLERNIDFRHTLGEVIEVPGPGQALYVRECLFCHKRFYFQIWNEWDPGEDKCFLTCKKLSIARAKYKLKRFLDVKEPEPWCL